MLSSRVLQKRSRRLSLLQSRRPSATKFRRRTILAPRSQDHQSGHHSGNALHSQGEPRPVNEPSSDKASANAMLIPAPSAAASPTRNVGQFWCVAKAAANNGARVDTDPSIRPARPGCTYCKTKMRRRVRSSSSRTSGVRIDFSSAWACLSCFSSASARSEEPTAHENIGCLFGGAPVEQRRLILHLFRLLTDRIERQI